jgi:GNAT superfamily N-acetyltransferase
MITNSRLRPGRLDDADVIADYHHRCWLIAFAPLVDPLVMEAITPRVARWQQWLAVDSEHDTVVATDGNDTPIGHCTVLGNDLLHLFIDPDHHGQGLGRVLLANGEERLRNAGHQSIQLHTIVGNSPAIALYESDGWVMTDRTEDDHLPNGSSYTEHIMVKDLR